MWCGSHSITSYLLENLYLFSENKIWLSLILSDVIADLYLWNSFFPPLIPVNHPLLKSYSFKSIIFHSSSQGRTLPKYIKMN